MGETLHRWRFPATGGREDLSPTAFGSAAEIEALAVARDGDLPAVALARDDGEVTLVTDAGVLTAIGSAPGPVTAIAFFASDADSHWIAVACPQADPPARVWRRARVSGAWGGWTASDLDSLPIGGVDAAAFLTIGSEPALAHGPHPNDQGGQSITVARLGDGQVVTAIDVSNASTSLPPAGLVGLTLAAPHAAVVIAGQPHATVVDLRCGATRRRVDLADPATAAVLVRVERWTWLVTAAGHRLEAWDALTGQSAASHAESADIRTIAALSNTPAGSRLLVAAGAAVRIGTPTATDPLGLATAVPLAVDPARVIGASLANDAGVVLALLGRHDGGTGQDRVEVWEVAATAELRQAVGPIAGLGQFAAIATPDGPHLAVATTGPGPIDVWNLPPRDRLPRLRWRLGTANAVAGAIAGSHDPAAPRVFLTRDSGPALWTLSGIWTVDSVRKVRAHAVAALVAPGVGEVGPELTARLAQATAAQVEVWIRAADDPVRRRLIPGWFGRGVHGFLARPIAAGVAEGSAAVAVWLDGSGRVAGSWLGEEVARVPLSLALAAPSGPAGQVPAMAEVVRLSAAPLTPHPATVDPGSTMILSGRIEATDARWSRLELHLGEIVIAGAGEARSAPRRVLAHAIVAWEHRAGTSRYPLEIQGPMVVDLTWPDAIAATGKVEIATGTYRVSPFEPLPVVPPPGNLALPRPDGTLRILDAVSTRRGGVDLNDLFIRFQISTRGILARIVRLEQVPVDLCLDDGATQPLETHPESVATLVHRRALARQFRYRSTTGELLTQSEDRGDWEPTPAPARSSRWLVAPVLRETRVYRVIRQAQVLVESAHNARAADDPHPRTENLLLLARPFASEVDGPGLLTCLGSATGTAGAGVLLDEARIATELQGVVAAGVVVHRILRDGQPATFRIVTREPGDELPAAAPVERIEPTVARPDFRALAPVVARRQLGTDDEYVPTPPVSEQSLDLDRLAWRRLRFADPRENDGPRRGDKPDPTRRAVFITEQTAFHRLPMPAAVPASSEFGLHPADAHEADNPSAWFLPRGLGLRLGPDKPGAIVHHGVTPLSAPAGSSRAIPASGASTVFAQREPVQTTPPLGADLTIETATRRALPGLQADRFATAWIETLGRIPFDVAPAPTTLVEQVIQGDPPQPSRVTVRFAPTELPFARIFVRINEDLFELDAEEARLPVYDARQSAITARPLRPDNALFAEDGRNNPRRPRPTAPKLGQPVNALDALATDLGGVLLAASETQLKVWTMADPATPIRTLTHPGGGLLRGVLTARNRRAQLLSTTDNTATGLFLIPLGSNDPAVPLPLPVGEVRDLASVAVTVLAKNSDHLEVELDVVVIAALTFDSAAGKTRLRAWVRSEPSQDGTRIDTMVDRQVDGEGRRLARVATLQKVSGAGRSHLRAVFATVVTGASPASTRAVAWELDPVNDADSRTLELPLAGADPDRFAITAWRAEPTRDEALIFVPGDGAGLIGRELATGLPRKRLDLPAPPPVHLAALGSRLVTVQDLGGGSASSFQTTLWDVETERPMRTIPPAHPGYELVVPVALVAGLHLAAARPETDATGALQVFDAGLAALVPPEIFFVTRLSNPFDPVTIKLKFTVGSAVHEQDVTFTPQLVHDSKGFPTRLHRSALSLLFRPDTSASGQGIGVWSFAAEADLDPTAVDLDWNQAAKVWFAWCGVLEHGGKSYPIEARMLEPSPFKTVNPIPFSAVAPKLAAVAFLDRTDGSPRELLQRTIFFGEAAGGTGRPRVGSAKTPEFIYELRDSETVDVPRPALANAALSVGLVLVKSFVNGQVVVAQSFPVSR